MSNANRIFVLENKKKKTNHILHLILTLLTGIWVFAWIGVAVSNSSYNKEIDDRIYSELEREDN